MRGAGSEQFANNTNPALNRELFEEGVDFIVKAWTTPGPFRYEGKHYNFRNVNPWVLPLQRPHPPFWIPGLVSPDTAFWCARKRYPYVALATRLAADARVVGLLCQGRGAGGLSGGAGEFRLPAAGHRGRYAGAGGRTRQADSVRRRLCALRAAGMDVPAGIQFQGRDQTPGRSEFRRQRRRQSLYGEGGNGESQEQIEAVKKHIYDGYPDVLKDYVMIAGTPDNVIPKLNKVLDVLRPGIFSFWLDGPVPAKDRRRCLELLNRDVIPAMRDYGKTLGLVDPFKRAPGSRLLRPGVAPEPVSNADALASMTV